ncbi:MAG: glycosyltransferase family 1 protein [Limnothrix sp.]
MSKILINLAGLTSQSTGLSRYTRSLLPYFSSDTSTLLSSQPYKDYTCYQIPDNLSPQLGPKGHLNRLTWTQFKLPSIYTALKAKILFSPISEAPLWSKCRSVVMIHDFIPLRFPRRSSPLIPYHRYYVPQVLKQAKHIVCNSEATAQDIIDFCQIPNNKITFIPLAYDAQHFQPKVANNNSLNQPYFLFIGRHDLHKNIGRIISAIAKLNNCDEYQLLLVGPVDDRHTPLLRQQIAELGLGERVKFLDYIPYEDLPRVISEAIALVFPSLWEGFGLPILEAMGCGTPVITSNLASMPEVAGDAAILVDPYNTAEIADAMQAIADDSQLRAKLSELGLARAKQFSWEKTGKATVEVLERFL